MTMINDAKGIVIMGAGGHAKVIIEIFQAMKIAVDYCIGSQDSPDECRGVTVLKGPDDELLMSLRQDNYNKIFIAVGSNKARLALAEKAKKNGFNLVNAISPHAYLSPSVKIGQGVAIMAGVIVNAETTIEDLAIINTGATIDHDCIIGVAAHIAPQCGLAGNVTVNSGTFLGVGTKVIPTITIGAWSVVGAGSIVIHTIPDEVTCVGIPAKIIREKNQGKENEKN